MSKGTLTIILAVIILSTVISIYFGNLLYGVGFAILAYIASIAYRMVAQPDPETEAVPETETDENNVSIVSDFDEEVE